MERICLAHLSRTENKCDYWDRIKHRCGICGRGIVEGDIVEIQARCGS